MTEKDLQELGFIRQDSEEIVINGEDEPSTGDSFYYYVFDIANGFDLISNSNDEVGEDGEWFVEIFDTHPAIQFKDVEEVRVLVNLVKSRIVE